MFQLLRRWDKCSVLPPQLASVVSGPLSDRHHAGPVSCTASANRTGAHPTPEMQMAQSALGAPGVDHCSRIRSCGVQTMLELAGNEVLTRPESHYVAHFINKSRNAQLDVTCHLESNVAVTPSHSPLALAANASHELLVDALSSLILTLTPSGVAEHGTEAVCLLRCWVGRECVLLTHSR